MPAAFDIIQNPSGVQFTENLQDIVLQRTQTNATCVKMSVSLNSVTYSSDILLYYDANGRIRINTRELTKELVCYSLPLKTGLTPFPILNIGLQDESGSAMQVAVDLIKGGVSDNNSISDDWWQHNFLTWQPQIVTMPRWQPQWLSFAKAHSNHRIHLISRLYTAEGCEVEQNLSVLLDVGLTRIDVSFPGLWAQTIRQKQLTPLAYDVYGRSVFSAPDAKPSGPHYPYAQRFVLRPDHLLDRCFFYQNSLGGFDTVMATGIATYMPRGESNTFVNNGEELELNGGYTSVWEQNTGYINSKQVARQWQEFLNSSNRYFYDPECNLYRKIVLEEYEVKDKTATPPSYTFKYHMARPNEGAYYVREELPSHPLPTKYFTNEQ